MSMRKCRQRTYPKTGQITSIQPSKTCKTASSQPWKFPQTNSSLPSPLQSPPTQILKVFPYPQMTTSPNHRAATPWWIQLHSKPHYTQKGLVWCKGNKMWCLKKVTSCKSTRPSGTTLSLMRKLTPMQSIPNRVTSYLHNSYTLEMLRGFPIEGMFSARQLHIFKLVQNSHWRNWGG